MPEENYKAAEGGEHILVGLSPSRSNKRSIETAARMAKAYDASFTALYIQSPVTAHMNSEDTKMLQQNIEYAKTCGASVAYSYGVDIAEQFAEYARVSGVTKIVIGQSHAEQRHFWKKSTVMERLIALEPERDFFIIPDAVHEDSEPITRHSLSKNMIPTGGELLVTGLALLAASAMGMLFDSLRFQEANIITIYILSVLMTALYTKNNICSLLGSAGSVLIFNFLFTEPRWSLHVFEWDYLITFAVMFVTSIIIGTMANKLLMQTRQSVQTAYRTKILLDTSQLLQKGGDEKNFVRITAGQLIKLLHHSVIFYLNNGGRLSEGIEYFADGEESTVRFAKDRKQAETVFQNLMAGESQAMNVRSDILYLPLQINSHVFGLIGIYEGSGRLEPFEESIVFSILGECALAMENDRNLREKRAAAHTAQLESVRANLLRSVSHDLRTPLTAISGNAESLLYESELLTPESRSHMLQDIYDDSQWLISLVENLLIITRIEENRLNVRMSLQVVDEVIQGAMQHLNRNAALHDIQADTDGELLFARMDPTLIVQVLVNLINNAIQYTPEGSTIRISSKKKNEWIEIRVEDNGPGIAEELEAHLFQLGVTGSRIGDSHRGMGMGLALCRSIINLHGGTISYQRAVPSGSLFTFTLPAEEVELHE